MWARAATDPALLARVNAMSPDDIAKLRTQSTAEPHYGYTRDLQEQRNLADQIIALRGQLGRLAPRDVTYMPRPRMLADYVNERESALTRADLDDTIDEAHANAERLGLN